MEIKDLIRLALAGVTSNKFRSFLTLLGIIIGVGAVILMVSLGSGTQQVVTGQFSTVVKRQVMITPNYDLTYHQRGRLGVEDREYLSKSTVGLEELLPFYRLYFSVEYNNRAQDNSVTGIIPGTMEFANLKLSHGRKIKESDLENRSRVAVVPERLLDRVTNKSNYSSLLGTYISVEGEKLLIIGIMEESNSVGVSSNTVLIPFTTAHKLWRRRTEYVNNYLAIYDQMTSEQDIRAQLTYLLNQKYGTTGDGESKFKTYGLGSQINIVSKILRVFTYVLGGVAAISLLVGGIGIMNIMLVTVKERTREIGIRLAIGATRGDIRRQFLLETVTLSISGGILGIIFGTLFSTAVNFGLGKFFNWWQGNIPPWSLLVSFLVTVVIAVVFGYYPAYKASRLDPIDALRYE